MSPIIKDKLLGNEKLNDTYFLEERNESKMFLKKLFETIYDSE